MSTAHLTLDYPFNKLVKSFDRTCTILNLLINMLCCTLISDLLSIEVVCPSTEYMLYMGLTPYVCLVKPWFETFLEYHQEIECVSSTVLKFRC